MERISLKTAGAYALTVATIDAAGAAVTATAPVAIEVFDGTGTSVYTGSATPTLGLCTAAVPVAELTELDTYTAVWTDDAESPLQWPSTVELCGGHLFEVADLRDFDPAFASTAKYPEAKMRQARLSAEIRFERAARLAFAHRARRIAVPGDGSFRRRLPDNAVYSVLSASVDGVALTVDELAALVVQEWGALDRVDGLVWTAGKTIAVHYLHGEGYAPEPVVTACKLLAREYLMKSSLSSRAISESTDVGFFRLSVAGPGHSTGIPEVDEVAREFGRDRPNIG